MMRNVLFILCIALAMAFTARAQTPGNMIGRQSQNEGIQVLPAPGKMTVDGKLDDWDFSGRIWVFADKNVRNRFAVELAAMYDQENLYIGAKWKDPTPMFSMVDPEFNPNDGWKSDSIQLRICTSDQACWLTTWFFAGKEQPVLHIARWKDLRDSRKGQDTTLLVAKPKTTILGQGAEMAYREDPDKAGYVQEIKIPWTIIYKQPPEIKDGLVFRMGMEFLWGDPTGKTWPVHRYADNLQPGITSREFFWTARDAWGDARLVAAGNVAVRKYEQLGAKLEGTVPIRLTLPKDAASFTVVVADESGKIVRSMGGLDPADYTVSEKGNERVVEVLWDGLTDKIWKGDYRVGYKGEGLLVKPGTYKVHGLYHHGLASEYEMCFYNPGTPPWDIANSSGAWGADHAEPLRVARAGDWMIVSWAFAEGGHGIIGIGPDGLKKWGEKRGGLLIAADDASVYAVPASWHVKREVMIRMDKQKGAYKPFVLDDKPRPFELPTEEIFGGKVPGTISSLAAGQEVLAVGLTENTIALLNKESASVAKTISVPGQPTALAFGPGQELYALVDNKVFLVDTKNGTTKEVPTPGVANAKALAVDNEGNIVIADVGPDSQVKAFSPDGKPAYTCGKQGGRPLRGAFDPEAMVKMSSVAVDAKGKVWVVESWRYPRRVSVWGKDGKLVRDYIGNTGYAGTGSFLHDQDPTLGYTGPIEMKLDKATRTWKVTQILWVPDPDQGESFTISPQSHIMPQRLRSSASGKPHEYLYVHDPRDGCGNVVFMERKGKWQPVAAVCIVGHISGDFDRSGVIVQEPSGEMAGLNAYDGVFWSDANGDGKVQRAECEIVPTPNPGKLNTKNGKEKGAPALSLSNGWGGRIGSDLTFYADGIVRYRPISFTADGAPVYGAKGMEKLSVVERGDLVPVPEENLLLCLSFQGYAGPTRMAGIDTRTGALRWTYPNPYPGVHGSHRATMPEPGLLIGPLRILGVVDLGKDIGRVFAMRGNLGQDFFMTTDGIFVGTMFEDGRLPGATLPAKEEQLVGVPMESFSNGGEPFNGCFTKQDDGRIRMTTGFARQACMVLQVKGLDTITRFSSDPLKIAPDLLAKIDADNQKRAAALAAATARTYTVKTPPAALKIDGNANDWRDLPSVEIKRTGSPESARARLAADAQNLYVLFEVNDASPWKNEGKDFARLFKTGDCVDVQLSPRGNRKGDPVDGDFRIVIANLDRKPTAVLMKPLDSQAPAGASRSYTSPVGTRKFANVAIISDATVRVTAGGGKYTVEAAIPLPAIGLKPSGKLAGDLGVISSDTAGTINAARTYWANDETNLVNDEPMEAWLFPGKWAEIVFE